MNFIKAFEHIGVARHYYSVHSLIINNYCSWSFCFGRVSPSLVKCPISSFLPFRRAGILSSFVVLAFIRYFRTVGRRGPPPIPLWHFFRAAVFCNSECRPIAWHLNTSPIHADIPIFPPIIIDTIFLSDRRQLAAPTLRCMFSSPPIGGLPSVLLCPARTLIFSYFTLSPRSHSPLCIIDATFTLRHSLSTELEPNLYFLIWVDFMV